MIVWIGYKGVAMESKGKQLGRRIAALRYEHAMDAPTLARRAGVSISTIRKLEAGYIDLPHPRTIQKIALDGFGMSSVKELTRGEKDSDYINVKLPRQEAMVLGLLTTDDMR
jgi:transcriptional regulator with XRE-family HTH domain